LFTIKETLIKSLVQN